jgi:hypothetical protein
VRRTVQWFLVTGCIGLAAGCGVLDDFHLRSSRSKAPVQTPQPAPEGPVVLAHLGQLTRAAEASPAGQAEIVDEARRTAATDPTATHRLRYALILSLPGIAGADAAAARTELSALLASPDGLLAAEQALAQVMLRDVNARLALLSENEQLGVKAGSELRAREQALTRRLQAQAADIERLQQEVEEAEAKLKAVAELEKSLAERQAAPKGPQP